MNADSPHKRTIAHRNTCYDETFIDSNHHKVCVDRMLFALFQKASGLSTQQTEETSGRIAYPTTPLLDFWIACCPGTVRKRSNRIHF